MQERGSCPVDKWMQVLWTRPGATVVAISQSRMLPVHVAIYCGVDELARACQTVPTSTAARHCAKDPPSLLREIAY